MKNQFDSREIFGAEIQYFRLDPKYWETIIRKFKDTGLRTVTTYVQWKTHLVGAPDSKHPAGVLDFEGKTDPRLNLMKFLDIIQKYDLNLNFRCGPFCCNEMVHGGYPPWLVLGDPMIMVWDYQNRTTQGYWIGKKEGSQPSYLHPEYLNWCRKWIAEVDRIILPRLKSNGGFITMINLDNEISYIVKDSFLDSDYNPVNVNEGGFYHQFLKEKYSSAANLPYHEKYKNIEDIKPPREIPEGISAEFPYYADWIEFKTWVMCRYIRELRKMHEDNGVSDVTFMTNFNPHLPEGVPTRMPDFEKAVGKGGVTGYDFYRGAFMSYSGYHSMARVLKLMNASLKYTWSAEFMSGTWNKDLSKVSRISDEHMMFMACCALAHGCKAIDWFMFHDRDCWGDAPLSSHGHSRTNMKVFSEIIEILFNKISGWDKLVPQNDVGIIYDLASHVHTSIGDPFPCNDNNNHVGNPLINGTEAGKSSVEYYGLFRLLEEAGVQAGVIDTVHSCKDFSSYKLVFMAGSPVISEETSSGIISYVENGGTLVISGALPVMTYNGKKINFPCRGNSCQEIKLGKGIMVWNPLYIAQEETEKENPEAIAFVLKMIEKSKTVPNVKISIPEPARWIDWQQGGGHRAYTQERCLGSAVIHKSETEKIIFILNHYPEAASFNLEFADKEISKLINLRRDEELPVANGKTVLDIDRKTCEIYRIE